MLNGRKQLLWLIVALSAVIAGDNDASRIGRPAHAAEGAARVKLTELSEINREVFASDPWLSEDALTIYWFATGFIWTAHRENPRALFSNIRHLCNIAFRTNIPLKCDPKTGRILGNKEASALWGRVYRKGWEP